MRFQFVHLMAVIGSVHRFMFGRTGSETPVLRRGVVLVALSPASISADAGSCSGVDGGASGDGGVSGRNDVVSGEGIFLDDSLGMIGPIHRIAGLTEGRNVGGKNRCECYFIV